MRRLRLERPELDTLAGDASLPRGKVRERRHAVADVVIGFGQHGQIQVRTCFRQLYKRDLQQRHARDSDQTFDTPTRVLVYIGMSILLKHLIHTCTIYIK